MYWNCQGVQNKKTELKHFVQQHKIHIILLNETQLSSKIKFKTPNFQIYRNDRMPITGNRAIGGTAIFILNKIVHHAVTIKTTSIDNTTIHIAINNKEMKISAVYKSPATALQLVDIDNLLYPTLPTILAGDLNSKHLFWHSYTINTAGRVLFFHMTLSDFIITEPTSPTALTNITTGLMY